LFGGGRRNLDFKTQEKRIEEDEEERVATPGRRQ